MAGVARQEWVKDDKWEVYSRDHAGHYQCHNCGGAHCYDCCHDCQNSEECRPGGVFTPASGGWVALIEEGGGGS